MDNNEEVPDFLGGLGDMLPADMLKVVNELLERVHQAWHGPSIIIAYAPCINHGLKAKGGMGKSQAEEKKAVECGYWHLWRFNPALIEEGKNPFSLDSKEPNWENFHAIPSFFIIVIHITAHAVIVHIKKA